MAVAAAVEVAVVVAAVVAAAAVKVFREDGADQGIVSGSVGASAPPGRRGWEVH